MKSRSQKPSVLPSGERKKPAVKSTTPPQNFDQLALSAHKLLNDEHLEVSKVRPFFWSLVETYVDRFQVYPFDVSKALFGYLELEACPEDEVQVLISKLEQLCEKKKAEMADIAPRLVVKSAATNPVLTKSATMKSVDKTAVEKSAAVKFSSSEAVVLDPLSVDQPNLDEDLEGLRACLKYASLVPEM